jgi:hypothetical protein
VLEPLGRQCFLSGRAQRSDTDKGPSTS